MPARPRALPGRSCDRRWTRRRRPHSRRQNELQQRGEAAEGKASDWWAGVQSDWARHIATAREQIQAKKAKADAKSAQFDADNASAYAEDAIDFAFGAVEEAEYAVLDAILAQMDADDLATT